MRVRMALLASDSKTLHTSFHPAAKPGLTLLEMAIGIMIVSILAVAVSSLFKVAVESQMSQRVHENMQMVAINIVDDLRFDIRTADSVEVLNGGNTLRITNDNGEVVYTWGNGGNFVRTLNNSAQKSYNQGFSPSLSVVCQPACFQQVTAQQILLPELRVEQTTAGGTVIDQFFSKPNYPVRNIAFDVLSATEFQ